MASSGYPAALKDSDQKRVRECSHPRCGPPHHAFRPVLDVVNRIARQALEQVIILLRRGRESRQGFARRRVHLLELAQDPVTHTVAGVL